MSELKGLIWSCFRVYLQNARVLQTHQNNSLVS